MFKLSESPRLKTYLRLFGAESMLNYGNCFISLSFILSSLVGILAFVMLEVVMIYEVYLNMISLGNFLFLSIVLSVASIVLTRDIIERADLMVNAVAAFNPMTLQIDSIGVTASLNSEEISIKFLGREYQAALVRVRILNVKPLIEFLLTWDDMAKLLNLPLEAQRLIDEMIKMNVRRIRVFEEKIDGKSCSTLEIEAPRKHLKEAVNVIRRLQLLLQGSKCPDFYLNIVKKFSSKVKLDNLFEYIVEMHEPIFGEKSRKIVEDTIEKLRTVSKCSRNEALIHFWKTCMKVHI